MNQNHLASRFSFELLAVVIAAATSLTACGGGKTFVDKVDKKDAAVDANADKPVGNPDVATPSPDVASPTDDGPTPTSDGPMATPDVADDSVPTCPAGNHLCAGACVSDDDFKTCGGSCSRCPDPVGGTATCVAHVCDGTCPSGKKLCHSACVDMAASCDGGCPTGTHACGNLCASNTEVNSCGTACSACPVPGGATQATCDGTKCDFTCGTGYHRCGATCVRDDSAGACGPTCLACPAGANGTPICVSGNCSLSCAGTYHLCGGACVSNTDVATCGTSCTACPVPGGGGSPSCTAGSCGGTCPSGKRLCAGACLDNATACNQDCLAGSHLCNGLCPLNTSVNSCGTTSCTACPMPTGANATTCDGTTCAFTCGAGYHKCGTGCSTDTDATACGASCMVCPTDAHGTAVCQGGVCGIMCGNGYHRCPASTGACVSNALTANCGTTSCSACAIPTGGGATCDGLSCGTMCPGGQQVCNGACIAGNLACNNTCPTGTHNCGGICSSDTAPATCGSRCTACPAPTSHGTASCGAGACGYACDPGYKLCPGTTLCVPMTAPAGCCGNADCAGTPSTPVCTNNVCVGRTLGSTCTAGTECASAACAEGVCCASACTGTCMSCLTANTGQPTGNCAAVKVNTAHGNDCSAQAASTCGTTGKCDGAGNCSKWPSTTVCLAQSCPGGGTTQTNASMCNGSGTCVAGGTTGCGVYKCNSTTATCRNTCTADGDCVTNNFCIGGLCSKKPTGYVCGSSAECTSGNCGGRCCPAGTTCNCPQPSAGNLLTNPGFEMDKGITGWQTTPGQGSSGNARWDSYDATGCPYSGSIYTYHFGSDESASFSQCVGVSPAKTYNFGASMADNNCINVWCELHWFSGPGCTGAQTDYFEQVTWTGAAWMSAGAGPKTPPSDSASVKIQCQSSPGYSPDCWSYWDEVYFSAAPGTY